MTSLLEYQNEIEKFVSISKKHPCVEFIYTYGSTGAPGLSDLDFLLVVSSGCTGADLNALCDEHDRETYQFDSQNFKVIRRSLLFDINMLGELDLNLVYAKKPGEVNFLPQSVPLYLRDAVLFFDIMDWMPERISNLSFKVSRIDGFTHKSIVSDLYSLGHSVRRIRRFCPSHAIDNWFEQVGALRSRYVLERYLSTDELSGLVGGLVTEAERLFAVWLSDLGPNLFTLSETLSHWSIEQQFSNASTVRYASFGEATYGSNINTIAAAYLNSTYSVIFKNSMNFDKVITISGDPPLMNFCSKYSGVYNMRLKMLCQILEDSFLLEQRRNQMYRFGNLNLS